MVLPEFAKVANTVVRDILDVKEGEEVLVFLDTRTPLEIGNVLREAANGAGARTSLLQIPKPPHGKKYSGVLLQPPRSAIAALKDADVIIQFGTIAYADYFREAIESGIRAANLGWGTETDKVLVRTMAEIDVRELMEESKRLVALWDRADTVKYTTKLGTDVTLDKKGLKARETVFPLRREGPHRYTILPPTGGISATATAPIKDGTFVFDGICGSDACIRQVPDRPIKMKVRNNMITEVEGDNTVWPRMKPFLDAIGDPNVYRLPAHFGVSGNPNAILSPAHIEWERVRGATVIGIADNYTLSKYMGIELPEKLVTKAKFHWDCQMLNISMYLDDKLVVKEGEILV